MSPRARSIAIATLGDELDKARKWQRDADENLEQAAAMLELARRQAHEAAQRVRDLADALVDIEAPKTPETGAQGVPEADGTSTDA